MVLFLKKTKKMLFILAAVLVTIALGFTLYVQKNDANKAAVAAFEEQNATDRLLVSLLLEAIRTESNRFYAPYYAQSPTIADYYTAVKDINANGAAIDITFVSHPYIGPHDVIGDDEITFSVSHAGEVELASFRHFKSYPLPENLRNIQIKLPSAG